MLTPSDARDHSDENLGIQIELRDTIICESEWRIIFERLRIG